MLYWYTCLKPISRDRITCLCNHKIPIFVHLHFLFPTMCIQTICNMYILYSSWVCVCLQIEALGDCGAYCVAFSSVLGYTNTQKNLKQNYIQATKLPLKKKTRRISPTICSRWCNVEWQLLCYNAMAWLVRRTIETKREKQALYSFLFYVIKLVRLWTYICFSISYWSQFRLFTT